MTSTEKQNSGSAPHVRGTFFKICKYHISLRFSPACAGNIKTISAKLLAAAVQPRMCGEHPYLSLHGRQLLGSAPHVRGTFFLSLCCTCLLRFSPACAGNIRKCLTGTLRQAVQPRMCGEHNAYRPVRLFDPGSAPHVRGTYGCGGRFVTSERFSPACAGNMIARNLPAPCRTVQPRMCGEHEQNAAVLNAVDGSAPHVRGTSLCVLTLPSIIRFSPACAGNIKKASAKYLSRTVQPRMCGEHGMAWCE